MADILEQRRERTTSLLADVRSRFLAKWPSLEANTTVYVVGSAGRLEMGGGSDLDPYIVTGVGSEGSASADGMELLSALRESIRAAGLPDLDADGEHAEPVTAASLVGHLGDPSDDSSGAMTKRILLLLESQPLVHPEAYNRLIAACVDAYWKNEHGHEHNYLPIVLVNDIVRYWRTVLLNHESRIGVKLAKDVAGKTEDEVALRRYSSFKLRIPRCLSCFSALLYLLRLTDRDDRGVTRDQVVAMVRQTPLERLECLRGFSTSVDRGIQTAKERYLEYLEIANAGKPELLRQLAKSDGPLAHRVSTCGNAFTEAIFQLVQEVGGGRPLHRAIVV